MAGNVNYEYFSSYIRSLPEWETLKVLDYGCGGGEVVELMRKHGIDARGCDVFYEGGSAHFQETQAREFIHLIDEKSPLPFGDRTFDVIVANQVFEHIDDFGPVLERLHRVLKDDGHMLLHFPTSEVIREGHIGLPFVHWMRPGSRLRFLFTLALRRAGLGYFKDGLTPREWT
ncbi:MAG TPA: class I SAM-dependent methyltransferase, partial [Thermoanaerobaculia bacterium]|nr:class I SAM-dependent methyltransferase [Thermoanaerobaculia bacterium]